MEVALRVGRIGNICNRIIQISNSGIESVDQTIRLLSELLVSDSWASESYQIDIVFQTSQMKGAQGGQSPSETVSDQDDFGAHGDLFAFCFFPLFAFSALLLLLFQSLLDCG